MNTSRIFFSLSCLLFVALPSTRATAETVTLPYEGVTLTAELSLADGKPLAEHDLVLITHGTLAHNKMELIANLQSLLKDADINSLAINLSLGVDRREGMYDCQVPHRHQHTDALSELRQWVSWAQQQQASRVILLGHSRGGNQTAWYSDTSPNAVSAQILIAPATWDAEKNRKGYAKPLDALLTRAANTPDEWLAATDFLYCPNSTVLGRAFTSYYADNPKLDTPYLLNTASIPTLVISGSEDKVVSDLPQKLATLSNEHVEHIVIEGADHFFRDLYADEALEHITHFMEQLP